MSTVFPVRFAWYLLAPAAAGLVVYLIAPILTPFLLSAVLAYICLPPVDWIARKLPRWLAAAIVMALLVIGLAALALIVLPMVERQFVAFLQRIPEYVDWTRARLLPWLSVILGVELNLDMEHFRQAVADSLRTDSDFLKTLLPRIMTGGMAIVGFFTTVLLMPVVLFYFLRDWHEIVRRIEDLIPRRLHPVARSIAVEIDRVLGLAGVWIAFGVGLVLEGMVVTPWRVGNRIGLHPVAVIFALLVFGKLFGFFGVLLALPASAALLVAWRHLRAHYVDSELYRS